MGLFRATFRVAAVLWTSFEAAITYAALRVRGRVSQRQRTEWLQRACTRALKRVGISVKVEGEPPREGLIVANHLSYADILALSSIMPCAFIAKKEVRSWPIFGWIAAKAGTLFVDRERRLDTARVNESVEETLRSGLRVVLFPEGSSSDGTEVLPFRPSLFEPAIASDAAITPAWIGYQASSGSVANDVCYWGEMTLLPHLFRMLAIRSITAHIRFGTSIRGIGERKAAAEQCRQKVLELRSGATENPLTAMSRR